MGKFQIFPDGRAAGSAPVSGSDFVTKDYLASESVAVNSASAWVAKRSASLESSASIWMSGTGQRSARLIVAGYASGSDASGMASMTIGGSTTSPSYANTASGNYSFAQGLGAKALANGTYAQGRIVEASGQYSHAEGSNSRAYGSSSHAEGYNTEASGNYSHAEGFGTLASSAGTHAEGRYTTASGPYSHAEGSKSVASGTGSHAEGYNTVASGNYSHAEGYYTTASNPYEHAQGRYNVTASNQIFSIGVGFGNTTRRNAISIITGSGVTPSASIYIYGVGTYNGTNPTPGTNDVATVISNLTGSIASASYSSTDKKIYFFNAGGTASAEIDATDFIKDGMVDSVEVSGSYLVLTFNTDAGKEPVSMSLTRIFNPDNFYTKTDVDTLLSTMSVGDVNVIEAVEFNGTASTINNKVASINVELPAAPNQDAENWVTENSASLVTESVWIRGTGSGSAILPTDFGHGDSTAGKFAVAHGDCVKASGEGSHAEGYFTVASGSFSHAEGLETIASGVHSHAEGEYTTASAVASHAEGYKTNATGIRSHAEGSGSVASGYNSHAEGDKTSAIGARSHAEGLYTTASGYQSHAEGSRTFASGAGAHTEGTGSKALGNYSHAEGHRATAQGNYAHAEGFDTFAGGTNANHAEGMYTTASGIWASHAEGYLTNAEGPYSHAEGNETYASDSGSHAEGNGTRARGKYSHAEGANTEATDYYSHAEGGGTSASAYYAHAEGLRTIASNFSEHAQGRFNATASDQIFSIGVGDAEERRKNVVSIITGSNPSASVYIYGVGTYDGTNPQPGVNDLATVISASAGGSEPLFIDVELGVSGNLPSGTYNAALEAYHAGRRVVVRDTASYGDITILAEMVENITDDDGWTGLYFYPAFPSYDGTYGYAYHVNPDYYVPELIQMKGSYQVESWVTFRSASILSSSNWVANNSASLVTESIWVRSIGNASAILSGSGDVTASGVGAIAHGRLGLHGTDQDPMPVLASGDYSHAEGCGVTSSGPYSHAEGSHSEASGTGSHVEGLFNYAYGNYSHAEGNYAYAHAGYSHAEGQSTKARGTGSHAEGYNTEASGNYSHAEGRNTVASGTGSHAEGSASVALGQASHAEGWNTRASGDYSHTEGQKTTASAQGAHAEGFGTKADSRYSHAEGFATTASAQGAHAEGSYTVATNYYEHAQGKHNATASNQIFSIGAGDTSSRRKNAVSIITGSGATPSASIYIYGIGGYNGTNPTPGTNDLATVINGLTGSQGGITSESDPVYLADSASLKNAATWVGSNSASIIASGALAKTAIQPAATASWDTAASQSHTHSNGSLLNSLTNAKTGSWDGAATWVTANSSSALAVSPASVTASINAAIGGITASHHTHSNKAVLDGITAAKTASWDSAATSATALNSISASLIASGTLAKNVTAITASLVASASVAKTASSSAAALSAKSASWDAKVGLPTVTAADNGKILRVVNGAWALVDPVTIYSGQGAPDSALGQDGDIYLQS